MYTRRLGTATIGLVLMAVFSCRGESTEIVDGVAWRYNVVNGEARLVAGDPAYAGDLVVPDVLGGYDVTSIDTYAFGFNANVTSVSLSRGVTNLPFHAFCNCSSLTNFTSRAAFIHYGESSLSGTALKTVKISEGETYLDIDVLNGVATLEHIELPSSLKTMGRAVFCGCTSLHEISFPEGFEGFGKTSNWEKHWQFGLCTGLEHVYFYGHFPTNLDHSGLLKLPNCKIHYLRQYAAEWEVGLSRDNFGGYIDDIGLPAGPRHLETNGVDWCYTVTNGIAVILPNDPPYAGDLEIPETLDGHKVRIDASSFRGNQTVTSIVLPAGTTNVLAHTFYYCTGLTNIATKAKTLKWGTFALAGTALRSMSFTPNTTAIPQGLLNNVRTLESIELPGRLQWTDMQCLSGCSSLKELWFPAGFKGFGNSSTMYENYCDFGYCTGLVHICFLGHVPSRLDTSGLLRYGKIYYPEAYEDEWVAAVPAEHLGGYVEDLTDPGRVRTVVVDGVTWNYTVSDGVATIVGGGSTTGTLELPTTLKDFPVVAVGERAFQNRGDIVDLVVPASITNLCEQAFAGCSGLRHEVFAADVPEGLEASGLPGAGWVDYSRAYAESWEAAVDADHRGWYVEDAGDSEMVRTNVVAGVAWCYTVANGEARLVAGDPAYTGDLVVPDVLGGYDVTSIDTYAFGFNANVTSVSLSRGVTNLPFHAFCTCTSLTNFTSRAAFIHYGESAFSKTALRSMVIPEGETHMEIDTLLDVVTLERLELPSTLRFMGRAACCNCASLREISIPEGFECFEFTSTWENHWQFGLCTGLEHSYFHGPVPENIEYSGLLHYGKVHYSYKYAEDWGGVVPAGHFGGYLEQTDNSDGSITATLPDGVWHFLVKDDGTATLIGREPAYSGDLVIPDRLLGYEVTAIDNSSFCRNLSVTSVSLPRGVTNLPKHAFLDCAALTNISSRADFIHYGESSLSTSGLYSFIQPEGETYLETDLLSGDSSLEHLELASTLTRMGRSCCLNCTSLREVYFPPDFAQFDFYTSMERHWQFGYCTGLQDSYFYGHVPRNLEYSGLLQYGRIHYPQEYAEEWRAVVPDDHFGGYSDFGTSPWAPCSVTLRGFFGAYDGEGHGVTVTGTYPADDGTIVEYSLSREGPYTREPPLFTNVCEATVWCRASAYRREAGVSCAMVKIVERGFIPEGGSGETLDSVTVVGHEGVYDGNGHGVTVTVDGVDDAGVLYAASQEDLEEYRLTTECPRFTNVVDTTVWFLVTASNHVPYVGYAAVKIVPRAIALTSGSASKLYDGTPLVNPQVEVTAGEFVSGEGVSWQVTGSQTEPGTSDNVFTWTPNPGTVTSNYEVAVHYGKLKVWTKGTVFKICEISPWNRESADGPMPHTAISPIFHRSQGRFFDKIYTRFFRKKRLKT